MPLRSIKFDSFNRGEMGRYMDGRDDLDIWRKSAQEIENIIVLPHGGIQFRRGFEFIMDITALDPTVLLQELTLINFNFNDEQQYTLLFRDGYVDIIKNDSVAVTIATTIVGANIPNIRVAQSGDTMIVTEPNTGIFKLMRNGSHTDWTWEVLTLTEKAFFQFNQSQTLTLNTVTVGTGRLGTLSGTTAYWLAGHVNSGIEIKDDATGKITITGLQNDGTGGTAYSSAGTAANAFDNNVGTLCSAGADGWIGYDFTSAATIRVVGIQSNTSVTLTLSFETDDNSGFTSATEVHTETVAVTAGTIKYIDVPVNTGEQFFRVRETAGETFTAQELILNKGLVCIATVDTAFTSGAQTIWTEETFGEHKGWARTVTFLNTRLWFGGLRDVPALLIGSQTGDLFNFDTGTALAKEAMLFSIASDQNFVIYDLKPKRDGLVIFTSDGELELFSTADTGLSPTSVQARQQTRHGISNIPTVDIDGELMFVTSTGKQIRSFNYEFAKDQYIAGNKTDLVHHLFVDNKHPIDLTVLKSYSDTQSTLLFVPREDGVLAVLSLDSSREVLAWSRWITDGSFGRSCVTKSLDNNNFDKDHLYTLVQRLSSDGSTLKIYLEKLTEEERYLDSWEAGTSATAKTTWSGATHLASLTASVVGDGLVLNDVAVDGSGNFTTDYSVSSVYLGLGYTGKLVTQYLTAFGAQGSYHGQRVIPKNAILDLLNTQQLKVNGRELSFRTFDVDTLGGTTTAFTGRKKIHISNIGTNVRREPKVTLTFDQPLPATVLKLSVNCKVS